MSDFTTTRQVTARKPWQCDWCGELEEPGTACTVLSGSYDGHMFRVRLHPECVDADREYMTTHGLYPEDRPEPGSMVRGQPLAKDEACEDCGLAAWTTWSEAEDRAVCAACAALEAVS